jgi:hypothetical protein
MLPAGCYFRQDAKLSVLLLAVGYLYSTVMAVGYLLAFPDAIAAGKQLIGTPQTISWIYNTWIAGYALLTLAAVVVETHYGAGRLARAKAQAAGARAAPSSGGPKRRRACRPRPSLEQLRGGRSRCRET